METTGFIFDYSKCVGCHACIVACYNQNHTQPPMAWRQVQTYNKLRIPLSGFINLSIACNHCVDAPCLTACPAKAYHRDPHTGAIIHDADKCIGCTYCTWACPFDAPRFNPLKGTVEKCNLCNDRLKEGLIPACANACPTGALTFNLIEVCKVQVAPGMTNKATSPRVNFKNQGVVNSKPLMDIGMSGFDPNAMPILSAKPKIDAMSEWPLAIFTLICALLVGGVLSLLFTPNLLRYVYFFAGLGVVGMALSALHLGKPFRAYRSILNIKTSWLSREIALFSAFMALSLVVFFMSTHTLLVVLLLLIGLLLLVSIEYVYSVARKKYKTIIHSANTILTAVTFGFLLTDYTNIAVGMIAIKGILYLVRYAYAEVTLSKLAIGFTRFFLGVMVPLVALMLMGNPQWVFIPFVLGELVDRFEFYGDIDIDTPQQVLAHYNQPQGDI